MNDENNKKKKKPTWAVKNEDGNLILFNVFDVKTRYLSDRKYLIIYCQTEFINLYISIRLTHNTEAFNNCNVLTVWLLFITVVYDKCVRSCSTAGIVRNTCCNCKCCQNCFCQIIKIIKTVVLKLKKKNVPHFYCLPKILRQYIYIGQLYILDI